MEFDDLSTEEGLTQLDAHLASRSYISSCWPTQNDAIVLKAIKSSPPEKFVHSRRWFSHMKSFGAAELKGLPEEVSQGTVKVKGSQEKREVRIKRNLFRLWLCTFL